MNKQQNGELWEKLSESQQQELFMAYEESFDEANLISHEEVKQRHSKWLSSNFDDTDDFKEC